LECEIDTALWKRVKNGVTTMEDETVIQKLINSFVLVWLPGT
jgi:hypothetical protein